MESNVFGFASLTKNIRNFNFIVAIFWCDLSARSVRKLSDLVFFCKNLANFNEVLLHEATLAPHNACVNLFLPSVDGKQNLSEVVFSAFVRFSL